MGCVGSKQLPEAQHISFYIDKQIYKDKVALRNEIKMLLLGAGESGKSTIVKQMKLIHQGTYTGAERESYKGLIFSNIIHAIQTLLTAMKALQIDLDDPALEASATLVEALPSFMLLRPLGPPEVAAIQQLWADAGVQRVFARGREFQVSDSTAYYLDGLGRIGGPAYLPDDQDILRARARTQGIAESSFQVGQLNYRLLDVGGQRNERKKWIHCFEHVTVIVFLAALSEYDQALREDTSVNRMVEALNLFDSICNSRWFTKTAMILFLNKTDLFRQKLHLSPIHLFFPDFAPPPLLHTKEQDDNAIWKSGAEFFSNKFRALNQTPSKQIYVHLTCATDTSQIRLVLAHVNDIIIQLNLSEYGLM
ncbi:hypothetical protein PtA15_12A69 [Puccinia triticina]|uniref:Guanine nucleotide-binding protein subunit alpha n=1 Tax=Puccinia triticina TaxID=208348 RepID=A0ABY7CZP9_9BASI|nr:uncharacterized protein PtA15_12A69 [Puccinia triticina]WAQ90084.1 hypothetical protein PtA15_12A69 [Puccinia triticina]WAR61371.1 hypothetical protein PtB15_12B56 [Puccinia triticina]